MIRLLLTLFLMIILAACNVLVSNPTPNRVISPQVSATDVSTETVDEPATEIPIPTATIVRVQNCPNAPQIQLIIQERGRVTETDDTLNLRRGPGTSYDIITRMPPGAVFIVLDGPACAEDYTWFRVRYKASGSELSYEGWIAEGDFDRYYAEPYLSG